MTLQARVSKLERLSPSGHDDCELSDAERARRILALLRWAQAHPDDEQAQADARKVCAVLGLPDDTYCQVD